MLVNAYRCAKHEHIVIEPEVFDDELEAL